MNGGRKGNSRVRIHVGHPERPQPHPVEVSYETDSDGTIYYVARSLELPGCMSDGTTSQEALRNLKDAIDLCSRSGKGGRSTGPGQALAELFVEGVTVQVITSHPGIPREVATSGNLVVGGFEVVPRGDP